MKRLKHIKETTHKKTICTNRIHVIVHLSTNSRPHFSPIYCRSKGTVEANTLLKVLLNEKYSNIPIQTELQ